MTRSLKFGFAFMLCMLIFAPAASAQQVGGYVDSWNTVSKAETVPELHVFVYGPLKAHGPLEGKVGWEGWALVSKDWSEAILNVSFAPAEWASFSIGMGLETDDNPLRGAASLWLGKGRFSLLVLQEYGGSGHWQRYVGLLKAKSYLSVGIEHAKFLGTGPRFEIHIGKVDIWGMYAATSPVHKGTVGLKLNFKK